MLRDGPRFEANVHYFVGLGSMFLCLARRCAVLSSSGLAWRPLLGDGDLVGGMCRGSGSLWNRPTPGLAPRLSVVAASLAVGTSPRPVFRNDP